MPKYNIDMHIVELQAKLSENMKWKNSNNNESSRKRVVPRTAKVKELLDFGYNTSGISQLLKLHPSKVDSEVARIEKEDEERRRFLTTLRLPEAEEEYFRYLTAFQVGDKESNVTEQRFSFRKKNNLYNCYLYDIHMIYSLPK